MRARSLARHVLGPHTFDEAGLAHRILRQQCRPGAGTMVDVGAHHGGALAPFAADGWHVHAFEPDPGNRAMLEIVARATSNVRVSDRAVTEVDGEVLDLFTSVVSTGISTLTAFHDSHQATARVTTTRLDTYLTDAQVAEVTFLKVDTEGYDLPVLRTFPWTSARPRAVLCEFENRKTLPLGYSYDDLARFLSDLGYAVFVSEWWPVIEYGASHRWRSFRRYPTALDDDDGWGNLLACDPRLADRTMRAAQLAHIQLRARGLVEHAFALRPRT